MIAKYNVEWQTRALHQLREIFSVRLKNESHIKTTQTPQKGL